ncbi:hypothetical protein Tco_0791201 [Tanacetum coccineum]
MIWVLKDFEERRLMKNTREIVRLEFENLSKILMNGAAKFEKGASLLSEESILMPVVTLLSVTCDDEDDYIPLGDIIARNSTSKAITPDLSIEEPNNSLNMGDEHLDTILATESDEIIKSSVENLVPIPSEFEGISDDSSDMPICDIDRTPISEEFAGELAHIALIPLGIVKADFDPDDDTSNDDDDFEDIEYVSLEEVNDVDQEEKEFNLEDIFQIQDAILREKLLKVHHLISNIESLKVNSTPDCVLNSPSSFPISVVDSDSFFEESDTSLSHLDYFFYPNSRFFAVIRRTRSGSTTTHANYSLPEYDSFLFEIEPDQEGLISIDNSNDPLLELPEFESFHFDPSFSRPPPKPPDVENLELEFNNFDVLNNNEPFNPGEGENIVFLNVEEDDSFTFTIRTFLPFVTYPEDYPDFEDSRAHGFVHSYIRASYPQLHLGNPIS